MKPLTGCRIFYTRSAAHWPNFQAKILELGGTAWHLPLMDTARVSLAAEDLARLAEAEYLVLTSANAARHLFSQFHPRAGQQWVAIGAKTAEAIARDFPAAPILTAPPPFNSESLLSVWQPKGRKIAIIAAAGGRKWLFECLQPDNAVYDIFAYRRFNPTICYPLDFPTPNVITIASKSTLNNLIAIIPQSKLKLLQYRVCLAVISAAVARYAAQLGFTRFIFAETAAESGQIEHICRWWNTKRSISHD